MSVWQDLRYSIRILAKHRGFSLVAILTLALAIGASTALFSVIDAALLHPIPYPHPEQLVELSVEEIGDGPVRTLGPSLAEARVWWASSGAFSQVCVSRTGRRAVVDTGEIERATTSEFSEGCLPMYGVTPIRGRGITVADTAADAPTVVLLAYGYWQSRFGGAEDVLGRTIRLPDGPATIVGVLPTGFERKTALVKALRVGYQFPGAEQRRGLGTSTYARLASGVTAAQAEARTAAVMNAATARLKTESLYDDTTAGYGTTMRTLAGAVGMIFMLACINVAGLLLARGAARQAELAVRVSLGAGRMRIVRQLLIESVVLGVTAGVAGVALAWISLDAVVALIPISLPTDAPATLNLRVLAFAVVTAVMSAVAFGLVPALRLSRSAGDRVIAATSRRHGSSLTRRNGQLLIAAEVAIAMVLLAGAGVMGRSFMRLLATDLGFDPERVSAIEAVPADPRPAVLATYYPDLLRAIGALPSVESAGAVDNLPLVGGATSTGAFVGDVRKGVEISQVLPGYFETMGLRLLAGRFPTDADVTSPRQVVVLDAAAATALFPGKPAIGRQLQLRSVKDPVREVVGVVSTVRQWGAQSPVSFMRPKVYLLFGQDTPRAMAIVFRTRPGLALSAEQLRTEAGNVGPRVLVEPVRTGSEWLAENTLRTRRRTLLFGLLGVLGVTLALVGIFSMTAYAVASRTREIGVRMALGARSTQVVRAVLHDAAVPVIVGTIVGIAAAAGLTRVIASFLFNTAPADPVAFSLATVALIAAGGIAAWLPARQAARVDPIRALRAD
jgi:putative ABC transport system permease protein